MGAPIETRAQGGASARERKLVLVVLGGPEKGATLSVSREAKIGKAPTNDLVISHDTVSRNHCVIERTAKGFQVRDLGSTNGTKIDNKRIETAYVEPGAVLRIGEIDISVRGEETKVEVLPSENTSFGDAIGHSLAMRRIFALLERVAKSNATVLFQGETGTGKDVLARALASEGARKDKPFVIVDCGAVSYSLIESELFGHEKGAFTGAHAMRVGAFELAHGGTLFLDEIGELPMDIQPKLLRVIESRELRRVGSHTPVRADVRIIAATKRDLAREVAAGKFREDLYFRLAVVPIEVPPLRQRRDDIAPLAIDLLRKLGHTSPVPESMLEAFQSHDWPGNVRELRNVLERTVHLASQSGGAQDLDMMLLPAGAPAVTSEPTQANPFQFDRQETYREARARFDASFEKAYLKWLLEEHDGNVSAAARGARMDRKYLADLIRKHEQ